MTQQMSPAEASYLRATQLLWAISLIDVEIDPVNNLPEMLLQSSVRSLTWQALSQLPTEYSREGAQPTRPGLLAGLEEVAAELENCPIWEYPEGTSQLIIKIGDAIARTKAGAW